MADYKQSDVIGTSWVRAYNVSLMNPLNSEATAVFHEETVVSLGNGKTIAQAAGACTDTFTQANASESFNLIHPVSGDTIGTATYQDVYVLLSSLYLHVALKRDATEEARQAELAALATTTVVVPPPDDVIPTSNTAPSGN